MTIAIEFAAAVVMIVMALFVNANGWQFVALRAAQMILGVAVFALSFGRYMGWPV